MTDKSTTTTNTTPATLTADQLDKMHTDANIAVYVALRARLAKSGLTYLFDLANQQSRDNVTYDHMGIGNRLADIEREIDHLSAERDRIVKLHDTAKRASLSLTLSASLREEHAKIADKHAREIARLTGLIKHQRTALADQVEQLSITSSDRADLVQVALTTMIDQLINPADITAKALASMGAESADELTEDEKAEAQNLANWYTVLKAVGKAISDTPTPEACNRITTVDFPATSEDVAGWIAKYGDTGANVKIPVYAKRLRGSDCYDTMEYKDGKRKKGWYRVRHYATVAPYQYIDNYTDNDTGEIDPAYIKTYNPLIFDREDYDLIIYLFDRANLTPKQRTYAHYLCMSMRYYDKWIDCRRYARNAMHMTAQAESNIWTRVHDQLEPIARELNLLTDDGKTRERKRRPAKYYRYNPAERTDLLAWINHQTGAAVTAPVINWTPAKPADEMDKIMIAHAERTRQTEQTRRGWINSIQTALSEYDRQHNSYMWTNAGESARVFLAGMTSADISQCAEITRVMTERERAQAEAKAKAEADRKLAEASHEAGVWDYLTESERRQAERRALSSDLWHRMQAGEIDDYYRERIISTFDVFANYAI